MSNREKLYAKLKGFPRRAGHDQTLAQIYDILSKFDDMVLYEVNERFLDLYTKKSLPPPIEIDRMCHQVKREQEVRVSAKAFEVRQERKQERERYNDRFALNSLHVHGAEAVAGGWQAPYFAFLARHERQPTPQELTHIIADHNERVDRWMQGGKIGEIALSAQRAKDARLAETINELIQQKETAND